MIQKFFHELYNLSIDMGFYMVIGLLFVAFFTTFMKKETIAKHLGKNDLTSSAKASLFGVPLPLCSCGVVPTAVYLKENGASNATVTSFLISTPQTGVDSIIATYGLMGITFAWFRPIAAFISGIFGGLLVSIFGKHENIQPQAPSSCSCCTHASAETDACHTNVETETHSCCSSDGHDHSSASSSQTVIGKLKASFQYAFGDFLADISLHFLIGLVIAAIISVVLPADFLVNMGLTSGIVAMLVMIVIGAPMYICSTASIPIALMLMSKGLSPGTAFVFLFMGPFTNIASLSVLSKVLGKKITGIYLFAASVASIVMGYLLDFLVTAYSLPVITQTTNHMMGHGGATWFKVVVAGAFMLLVLYHLIMHLRNKRMANLSM